MQQLFFSFEKQEYAEFTLQLFSGKGFLQDHLN